MKSLAVMSAGFGIFGLFLIIVSSGVAGIQGLGALVLVMSMILGIIALKDKPQNENSHLEYLE